jgi:hypothetical protein
MPKVRLILVSYLATLTLFSACKPPGGNAEPAMDLPSLVRSLGVLGEDATQSFGEVTDVALSSEGFVYILDRLAPSLSVFDSGGVFRARTGSQGSGPGEFLYPVHLGLSSDGNVWVLDLANNRFSVFHPFDVNRGITRAQEYLMEFPLRDFCFLGPRLYGLGFKEGLLLHELEPSGGTVRSFGEPLMPDDPLLAREVTQGILRCDAVSAAVVLVGQLVPIVRVYNPEGILRWESTIPGFTPTTIERTARGGVRYSSPEDGTEPDVVTGVAVRFPEFIVVQFGASVERVGSVREIAPTSTVAFRLSDGAQVPVPPDFPRVDYAAQGLAFGTSQAPFPQLHWYRWGG